MNGKQILHLVDSAGMYGAERVILTLLNELRNSSFPGVLGCIREEVSEMPLIAAEAMKMGVAVEFFTMKRGLDLGGAMRIIRYALENGVRIIHTHGYKPNILLSIVPRRGIKVVSTVHGWAKRAAGPRAKLYEFLDALSLRRMDRLVAVSAAVRDDLTRRGVGAGHVSVIYNGLRLEDYACCAAETGIRSQYGLPQDAFVIGAVGRLAAVKGFEYLVDALALVKRDIPDCRLLIAGDGPLKENLNRKITALGLASNVQLVGYQKSIVRFLSAIDLFVMPSLSEGLPIALLEAMLCRKPVIASAVGGIPEVIAAEENGLLVEPENSKKIAEKILFAYRNPSEMNAISMQGWYLVERKFSSKNMANNYAEEYLMLLSATGSVSGSIKS